MVKAFMTIKHGHDDVGTLHLELYDEVVPKTVKNFMALLEGSGRLTYKNSISHRLIPGFMAQFGDITKGDGTGGESIYGESFDDENFEMKHKQKGTLSMANSGPNTNSSQFFVTLKPTPQLDGKHVVFGHVDLERSYSVLTNLGRIKAEKGSDRPLKPVVVVDCGVVFDNDDSNDNPAADENAATLPTKSNTSNDDEIDIEEEEEEPEVDESNMTKAQKMKNRMRKLKMKMNQARQLNRKALRQEGEAMGSEEGQVKQRKQQKWQEKKLQKDAWEAQNARAVQLGEETGVDAKYLVESASSSLKTAYKKAAQRESREYNSKDHHNPEGQHRNYEKSLKSISRTSAAEHASSETYNPMMDSVDAEKEREGARRLANELHRRIQKAANKRDRLEFDEEDVSHINKRNKQFNKQISRDYNRATNEIKQNLERGTAL